MKKLLAILIISHLQTHQFNELYRFHEHPVIVAHKYVCYNVISHALILQKKKIIYMSESYIFH